MIPELCQKCKEQKPMVGISNKTPVAGCHHPDCHKWTGYFPGRVSCMTAVHNCPKVSA